MIATCVNPAWLEGAQRRRGKLLPGYLADLVVLDRDPFDTYLEDLAEIKVVATMVGGRWVHNPPPLGISASGLPMRTRFAAISPETSSGGRKLASSRGHRVNRRSRALPAVQAAAKRAALGLNWC